MYIILTHSFPVGTYYGNVRGKYEMAKTSNE